ncbi:AAA-ATPase At2g46620-like [Silene latifolia]|uniref:AAA-ATPase At2g46620-like n=1 Tax=Silene latifolia TaxID=37657 RepID=UPI003D7772DD
MEFRQLFSTIILIVLTGIIVKLFLNRTIRTAKLIRWWRLLSEKFHDHQFLKIPELNDNSQQNHLFRRVSLYLNSLQSLEDSDNTNLFSGVNPNDIVLSLNDNQTVVDTFLDARIRWTLTSRAGGACFTLTIRKRDKRRVLRPYLQHIHVVSDEIDSRKRELRLFTPVSGFSGEVSGGVRWRGVPFTHPATMETIAMEIDIKNKINLDLDNFLKSKQFYHRLGKVWRRSYLLYGPSGTGKSSFAAALAKTLSYDVYNLELSSISDDSELKHLLLQTTPRSVILVEDFDKFGTTRLTASGVMNFMDGVVSSCCEERVMVFTMTTKDEIAPEILRPGRIDVHIHFPMCDFNNFKCLASSYLGVKEHKLFSHVEEVFSSGATLSPAEISELMLVNRNSPSRAIKSVITALQTTSSPVVVAGSVGGESCKGTPDHGFKSGDSVDGGSGTLRKDGVKEIKKLYGLLRRKSSICRVSDSFVLDS